MDKEIDTANGTRTYAESGRETVYTIKEIMRIDQTDASYQRNYITRQQRNLPKSEQTVKIINPKTIIPP